LLGRGVVCDMSEDATYQNPLEKIAGKTEVETACTSPSCAWSDTVELDEPATLDEYGERITLPGFTWECPKCGNPHEFIIEGVGVSNLV